MSKKIQTPGFFIGALLWAFVGIFGMSAGETSDIDVQRLKSGYYVITFEEHYHAGVGESVLTLKGLEEGYFARWEGIHDTTEVYLDTEFRTERIMYTKEDTAITVKRRGEQLHVSGIDEGDKVDKTLKINSEYWFQLLPVSLIPFISSDERKVKFSMFDPFEIKLRDMQIEKKKREHVTVFDVEYDTLKLSMRLRGILTPFWKSEMWCRTDSGFQVKYEGLNVVPKLHKSKILLKRVEFKPLLPSS